MTRGAGAQVSSRSALGAKLISDERLALRAAQGDEHAFAAIFERYGQSLYRFCASIVGNSEDAHDALQNTMVKVLQALPGERRRIQLRPWLYRIAHNESVELLRRRRDTRPLDPETAARGGGLADTAERRQRLRTLLRDLDELPERQRGALVMRELAGLEFAQIAAAFETSAAVARQAVYEARQSLQRLEAGREMSCAEVTRQLSDEDGRTARRRELQAHLRACPRCRAFAGAIESRREDFAALAPLPAVAVAGILHAALGGAGGGASAAGATAATGAGATIAGSGATGGAALAGVGKVAATSALVKSVATVAVVATVGVTAADRGGLIDARLPGGDTDPPAAKRLPVVPATPAAGEAEAGQAGGDDAGREAGKPPARSEHAGAVPGGDPRGKGTGHATPPQAGAAPAAAHGRETATARRGGAGARRGGRSTARRSHPSRGASQTEHGRGQPGHSPEKRQNAVPPPQPEPQQPAPKGNGSQAAPQASKGQPPAETGGGEVEAAKTGAEGNP
ncbi:MAG TPA: RNA polymerase sigma factor [Solirubrobacterales bacterium]|nr:RNA polymerase sigma factor [Solirubrobacterales bacterium]